jgi:outer membrane protein assembly factor BamD (BamD/ComL family)
VSRWPGCARWRARADDEEEDSDSKEDDDAEPVEWYDKGTTRLPRKASEWAQEQAQDVDLRVL